MIVLKSDTIYFLSIIDQLGMIETVLFLWRFWWNKIDRLLENDGL